MSEYQMSMAEMTFKEDVKDVLRVEEASADYITSQLYGVEEIRVDSLLELLQEVRRREKAAKENMDLSSTDSAGLYFSDLLYDKAQEEFWVAFLNNQNRIITSEMMFKGSATASLVSPAVIYRRALELNAQKILVAHNHPSGDPEPSSNDVMVTERLSKAGELFDIALLDHIIVGGYNDFVSLREKHLM